MKDFDYDFGFSSVSEEDIQEKSAPAIAEVESRVDTMYNMIMPLLNNLMKDSDKNDYIHWPNRKPKIEGFVEALNKVKEGK